MRHLVKHANLEDKMSIESAGTGSWHVGHPPDERSYQEAMSRGVELVSRARQFQVADFDRLDYVLPVDRSTMKVLLSWAPNPQAKEKVQLLRRFASAEFVDDDIPDPYYGGDDGFRDVYDICEAACRGFLDHVRRQHKL